MTEMPANWFGVRCVFELDPRARADTEPRSFEERVTIWRASGFDRAIELAEADAVEYATTLAAKYFGPQHTRSRDLPRTAPKSSRSFANASWGLGRTSARFSTRGERTTVQLPSNRARHRGTCGRSSELG